MKILVANLGSTSLKWRLFDFSNGQEKLLHKGGFERVTQYPQAITDCLAQLREAGHIKGQEDLAGVGFKTIMARGVNGCVRVDDAVLRGMEEFISIAPAHNPPYISGIRIFAQKMPKVPLVALFETAFYQWISPAAQHYAVPDAWHERGVRRWGFHGASHKFIAERSAELLGRDDVAERARRLYVDGNKSVEDGELARRPFRVISCHLGGSSSITGIRNGVAVGTSMGMSPQSGLPHNNRVGDLDSAAIPFMMRTAGLSLDEAEKALSSASGLKALSGGYNDIRDILQQAQAGNAKAQLAIDVLVHQARHWIGAFLAELNGADALVFTAGIGENSPLIRAAVCEKLGNLGIVLDPKANESCHAAEQVISAPGSAVKILVIPANEELVVAREVKRQIESGKRN